MLCDVDLARLQSRVNLAAVHDLDIQLVDLRLPFPVCRVGRIGNIMVGIVSRQDIRPADYIRRIEPVGGSQLFLTEFLDDMLRQNM